MRFTNRRRCSSSFGGGTTGGGFGGAKASDFDSGSTYSAPTYSSPGGGPGWQRLKQRGLSQTRAPVIDASYSSSTDHDFGTGERVFHQKFGLTGLVVTKLDGTSKGGSIVAIYRELKLPIHFIGLGEAANDLLPFSAERYVRSLFADLEDEGAEDLFSSLQGSGHYDAVCGARLWCTWTSS